MSPQARRAKARFRVAKATGELLAARRELLAAEVACAGGRGPVQDVGFWGFLGAILGFRSRQTRAWDGLADSSRELIRMLYPEAVPADRRG